MKKLIPLIAIGVLAGCQNDASVTQADAGQDLSYNWDVKPILSDNCFACHGPDAEGGQKAGLRLDTFATATGELPESPGKFAIVPGSPDSSELIRRITSADPDVVMPPPKTHKTLSAAQQKVLRDWIESGAEYQPHWAYVSVRKPSVPADAAAPIDYFIDARLQSAGLAFEPEADRATLVNRLYMDLTGLPPSLEAVETFVADDSPMAYEKLVDALLASDEHAEHMTAQWLDIARFADTDGYLEDAGERLLHPWRDWVIGAFKANMPFDEFSTWQIAGDLLPSPTREQRLATTFLRLGQRSSENGIIEEEYLNEYAIDRLETVGVGYLGHTVGCARCHDHKYDPISIKDFYSFAAFFSATAEPGFYTPGGYLSTPIYIGVESGPTLPLPDAETERRVQSLATLLAAARRQYESVRAEQAERYASVSDTPDRDSVLNAVRAALADSLVAHYPFDEFHEGSLDFAKVTTYGKLGPGKTQATQVLPAGLQTDKLQLSASAIRGQVPAVVQSPISGAGHKGQAFFFDTQNKGFMGGDVGDYDRTDPFSLDFWVNLHEVYDDATIINHNQHARFSSMGYTLDVEKNHLRFDMVHTPSNLFSVIADEPVPVGQWSHITVTYDGSSTAAGVKLYLNGKPLQVKVLADNLTQTIVAEPFTFIDDTLYGLAFGKRWQQFTIEGSGLDEVKVFNRELSPLEVACLEDEGAATVSADNYAQFRLGIDPTVAQAREALRSADAEHNALVSKLPEIMVMDDSPFAKPMHVKKRGVYSDPGEEVAPQAFSRIFEWRDDLPRNRLGLTQWLFDPANPLTSRVYINRLWQSMFGRGLVETAEDFGTQGSIPTHPQLLDWLAAEFMESGWDIRHMEKLMVMSRTYRQGSDISPEKKEVDPFNLLLSRGVRQRYSMEVIRDNALATGGLLDKTIGGNSVYPYQPPGVWLSVSVNQITMYPEADEVPLSEHHRRTMYNFIKRAAPHPAMQVFDMPQRISTVARRRISNTPLQALVMLNDQQYLEAYEGMAYQAMLHGDDARSQVAHLYAIAMRRKPYERELNILLEQYANSLQRFSGDREKATRYLSAGLQPFDVPDAQLSAFAALASTARVVMNSPDAYSRH
ncbi:MAG: DUF1553 domain-containing protein [Gammaproteobacteria bacterium]|nr:DUF1553 domain-containing protein [Gammaproteobacteria bacterium]